MQSPKVRFHGAWLKAQEGPKQPTESSKGWLFHKGKGARYQGRQRLHQQGHSTDPQYLKKKSKAVLVAATRSKSPDYWTSL